MPSNVPQAPPPPPSWGTQAPPPPSWDRQVGGAPMAVAALRPGGFWIRLVAMIVDGIVLGIPMMIVWSIVLLPKITENAGRSEMSPDEFMAAFMPAILGIALFMLVIGWLYEALMTSSRRGATIGKMVVGLRVLRFDGTQLSFGRATGRHFAKSVVSNLIPFAIAYIMAAFTDRKRALHDMIADTIVVHVR